MTPDDRVPPSPVKHECPICHGSGQIPVDIDHSWPCDCGVECNASDPESTVGEVRLERKVRRMRTREKNFVDVKNRREVYSFQFFWRGGWVFPSDGAGGVQTFGTKEARDAARTEFRKKPTVSA